MCSKSLYLKDQFLTCFIINVTGSFQAITPRWGMLVPHRSRPIYMYMKTCFIFALKDFPVLFIFSSIFLKILLTCVLSSTVVIFQEFTNHQGSLCISEMSIGRKLHSYIILRCTVLNHLWFHPAENGHTYKFGAYECLFKLNS